MKWKRRVQPAVPPSPTLPNIDSERPKGTSVLLLLVKRLRKSVYIHFHCYCRPTTDIKSYWRAFIWSNASGIKTPSLRQLFSIYESSSSNSKYQSVCWLWFFRLLRFDGSSVRTGLTLTSIQYILTYGFITLPFDYWHSQTKESCYSILNCFDLNCDTNVHF